MSWGIITILQHQKRLSAGLLRFYITMMSAWGKLKKSIQSTPKRAGPRKLRSSKVRPQNSSLLFNRGFTMKLVKAQNQITSVDINDNFEIRLSAGLAKMLKTRHRL